MKVCIANLNRQVKKNESAVLQREGLCESAFSRHSSSVSTSFIRRTVFAESLMVPRHEKPFGNLHENRMRSDCPPKIMYHRSRSKIETIEQSVDLGA